MCCFTGPVRHVANTRIFARALAGGRQALVYAMRFDAAEDLAMVLPIAVPPRSGESAVTFVSLENYPTFFADLARGWPPPAGVAAGPSRSAFGAPQSAPPLVVQDVGAFEASFVPTVADFNRLDARFRLPAGVWDRLPVYADYGFAVFKLKAAPPIGLLASLGFGAPVPALKDVHPMAFTFPRRDASALFFPTVHVHDGDVHAEAAFDHTLYAQGDDALEVTLAKNGRPWSPSASDACLLVDERRAAGLVDLDRRVYMRAISGKRKNQDIVVGGVAK